jgi:hypothetical protein
MDDVPQIWYLGAWLNPDAKYFNKEFVRKNMTEIAGHRLCLSPSAPIGASCCLVNQDAFRLFGSFSEEKGRSLVPSIAGQVQRGIRGHGKLCAFTREVVVHHDCGEGPEEYRIWRHFYQKKKLPPEMTYEKFMSTGEYKLWYGK